ncbi:putative chemotaxis protein-glutamate methylesterase [Flavobacterium palustre]|uniref:protein-glutamate methylesterase n=1 Tax=Flavobacterium palustre TaxID=1476463 RepID=A0ABQ1HJK2_9FLAO|nr:chemotaxis protein CheB [Flavobacterium palustre]GGA80466.1 putative chemotaxis protein-glutamate methylesterase [Flavobacterium palustre]
MKPELIVIGGSAGAFEAILSILNHLDKNINIPIVIVLHRLRNTVSSFEAILQRNTHYLVKEIEDKQKIEQGCIYTAPADYHLLLEEDLSFSLDVSEAVNFSRPSIDVTFESFSTILKEKCCGILLSGSNHDGANGLKIIAENNGTTIIQDCNEAEFAMMPKAAKTIYNQHQELNTTNIINTLNNEYR